MRTKNLKITKMGGDMKRIARLIVLLLSLIFLWGCELALIGVGAGLGVGTYSYIQGSLERDYPLAYSSIWDATNTALANLSIAISSSINEGTKGSIEGVRKDGVGVKIKLQDRGQNVTTVNVRVGFSGRKDAERIHEEIKNVAGLK